MLTTDGYSFTYSIGKIPQVHDSVKINSVSEYVFLEHLLRPLITYNTSGELQGDLASRWHISSNFKNFNFQIKRGQKFSDGTIIDSKAVVKSLERSIRIGKAIHYNFSNIKRVRLSEDDSFEVELFNPDPFFIYELEHPEFRIVSSGDAMANVGEQKFQVTSGPYRVVGFLNNEIALQINENYPHETLEAPQSFVIKEVMWPLKSNANLPDMIWSSSLFTKDDESFLKEKKYQSFDARLGFSYWLSFNISNENFKNINNRIALLNCLSFSENEISELNPLFKKSNQLFLSGGPGRMDDGEIELIVKNFRDKNIRFSGGKIVLLLDARSSGINSLIIKRLSTQKIEHQIDYYQNFGEYASKIQDQSKYDIVMANNDFSGLDLRGAINVAMNSDRPLILSRSDKKLMNIVDEMSKEPNSNKRYSLIKDIGKRLLEEAYLIPLYYFSSNVYYREGIDVSHLSKIISDASVWKIKLKK